MNNIVPRTPENIILCPIECVSTCISLAIKPLECNEYSIDSRKSVLTMWWNKLFSLHALWNISDFGANCEQCEAINTITLEDGEPENVVSLQNLRR
jgi:hypothetical protein